jgi:hypothetical protein
MIRFVIVPGLRYTLRPLLRPLAGVDTPPVEVMLYRDLFESDSLPSGTWVFCDIERLGMWELRLAGEIARLMRKAGSAFRVINDPARAASRYELLLRLHREGFNHFRAWRAEDGVAPARFPVFLRLESDHRRPLTGLLHTADELAEQIDRLPVRGIARSLVLVIEYHADELAPGVFRKFSAYRFGERIVADHLVHDISWVAKIGNKAAWTPERFADENAYVRDNPHADALMRAFEIGCIQYGRADYGIIGGVAQVWEINTNPRIPTGDPAKAPPERAEATIAAREKRMQALGALDIGDSGISLPMDSDFLLTHRKRQVPGSREMFRK